jgi:hypothetical protein
MSLGGAESGFGHSLIDPQFLSNGSVCSIFEGGHIHQLSPSKDAEA